ncbi:MAG: hypothetical protein JNJ54_37340 [Myxococcaceae bacterium]|nr:hypothetical protein [Myxococcaceae bacterium]
MSSPRPWTVFRPGPLTQRGHAVWTVDDDVPGLPGATRRMSVIRRPSGDLVFFNAVPVPEASLEALKAIGRPAHLLVPNVFHALDVPAFIQRLGVTAWVPDVSTAALSGRFPCRPVSAFPKDEGLRLFTVEGFKTKEIVLVAERTLFTGDLVTNSPHGKGAAGFLMRVVGFTGPEPKLPFPVRQRVQTDRQAVKALLATLAALELDRLVPTHGAVVDGDVAGSLRKVAAGI